MQPSTQTRGQPADETTRARVRAVVDRFGWLRAAGLLGLSQHAIERLLAGAPVLKSTSIAARLAVAQLAPEEPRT
jgi:hypothetical protein